MASVWLTLVGPILFGLPQNGLGLAHLTLELSNLSVGGLNGGFQSFLLGLFTLDPVIDLLEVLLHVSSLVLNPNCLVDDLLHSRATRLQSQNDLVLLSGKTVIDSLDLGPGSQGPVHVSLGFSDLGLVLCLELAELAALEVGLDGEPELEPEPGLGHHVGPDGALAGVQGHLLVLQLRELHPGCLATSSGLEPGEHGADLVLTLLLHPATNSSPEEDLGVTETELLLVELDDVHDRLAGSLVILGLGHSLGSQDVVAGLELWVLQFVGESSPADGNTGEHAVALVLVHDQGGLHASGLLVGVGHHATDEVGLSLVQRGHQVVQLALEVGGHSLATLALLAVSSIFRGLEGLTGMVLEAGNGQSIAAVLDQLDDGVVEGIL